MIVIQVYAPTSNAEEAEIEWLYEIYKTFRTNTPKRCPFHYRGLECKRRKSRNTWSKRQIKCSPVQMEHSVESTVIGELYIVY